MSLDGTPALFLGAVALGAVHGIEPGHGWPVAASYALDQTNKWFYGVTAGLIIGVGHLVSSIAMVGVFFFFKGYFELTRINEPITMFGTVRIGGPVSIAAGILLIALGLREYRHGGHGHGGHGGHGHGHGGHGGHGDHGDHGDHGGHGDHGDHGGHGDHGDHGGHGHGHGDHDHGPGDHDHGPGDHGEPSDSLLSRLTSAVPFGGGHSHAHSGKELEEQADAGLFGIAWFAFVLGFAHEEEFEIIALCAGSDYCLELMSVYAVTVISGIVGLTLLLLSGYHHFEDEVEQYTPYLPVVSAVILVVMGVGFVAGLF